MIGNQRELCLERLHVDAEQSVRLGSDVHCAAHGLVGCGTSWASGNYHLEKLNDSHRPGRRTLLAVVRDGLPSVHRLAIIHVLA